VRALAAVLHECLVGEPPAAPARPLDAPGLPPALAAVVDLALGATGGQPLRSAAVLGEAVAAALPLATREAVASYVEAILPAAEGERAALTRLVARATGEDVQEDLAVELVEEETATETATPVPTGSPSAVYPERSASALAEARSRGTTPTATPIATPTAIPDPTGSPSAVHPERSATATAEAVSRGTAVIPSEPPSDRAVVRAEPIVIPARRTPAPPPPAEPLAMMHGAGDAPPAAPARSPDSVSVFPAPTPAARRRSRAPLAIAAACALIGFGAGFAATRGRLLPDLGRDEVAQRQPAPTAEPRPAEAAAPEVAVTASLAEDVRAAEAVDAVEAPPAPAKRAKPAQRKPPATRVAAAPSGGKGFLVVTAPAEAEVLLDGRRIGKGDVRREVDVGAHRVEVRLGEARVMEQFTLVRGETWTYDVTPTGN
jgi:hypothetical protein